MFRADAEAARPCSKHIATGLVVDIVVFPMGQSIDHNIPLVEYKNTIICGHSPSLLYSILSLISRSVKK